MVAGKTKSGSLKLPLNVRYRNKSLTIQMVASQMAHDRTFIAIIVKMLLFTEFLLFQNKRRFIMIKLKAFSNIKHVFTTQHYSSIEFIVFQ